MNYNLVFLLVLGYDLIITRIWMIKMRCDRIFREINSLLKKLRNKKLSKQAQHAGKQNFGLNAVSDYVNALIAILLDICTLLIIVE